MRRAALPTSTDGIVERLTDSGRRGDIRQQTRPDMGTTRHPPAVTVIFGYDAVRCTGRVPFS
jgi:hypothetical protein